MLITKHLQTDPDSLVLGSRACATPHLLSLCLTLLPFAGPVPITPLSVLPALGDLAQGS